jgi:hypothetical protein
MKAYVRRAILSALSIAVAAAVPLGAQAQDKPLHRHHPRAKYTYVPKTTDLFLEPNGSAAVGTEDHYYSDTITPHYPLGPAIYQRWGN